MTVSIFIALSVVMAVIDAVVAILALRQRDRDGVFLAFCMIFSAVVDLGYLNSVLADTYFGMSLSSSIYFSGVDLSMVSLLAYFISYTDLWNNRFRPAFMGFVGVVSVVDIAFLMVNPFAEISLTYTYEADFLAHWAYSPYLAFTCHLVWSYFMVAVAFAIIIAKIASVPRVYRGRYVAVLVGLVIIVFVNALFLYLPKRFVLDYSLMFYSVMGVYLYLTGFRGTSKATLAATHEMIFDQMGRAFILFDFEGRYATSNEQACVFIAEGNRSRHYWLSQFLHDMNLDDHISDVDSDISFTKRLRVGTALKPYRVDLRVMRDEKNRKLGSLIVFVDYSFVTDLLTGFNTKTAFERRYAPEANKINTYPVAVGVCDLNHLANLNEAYGREQGDAAIKMLADAMVANLPENSYFVRHDDANLVVICEGVDGAAMHNALDAAFKDLKAADSPFGPLEAQSAVSVASVDNPSVIGAVKTALDALKLRKMLDYDSAHSSLLASLAMTQRQSDGETEEHVRRTRAVADRLAKRMGLSDWEQSSLALLCLLHDIGKVGVPLEILNKPGKLTDAEWAVLKSHSEKGYRIASASEELGGIAESILHHHERWDGKGYPDGLSREAIPMLSRVLMVVDTYDAMTHDRPYRRALSREEAMAELKRCAGTQFDPSVVAEFLAMMAEGMAFDPALVSDAAYVGNTQPEDKEDKTEVPADARKRHLFAGRIRQALTDEERLALHRMDTVHYARYILDEDQKILSVSKGFEELTGYTQSDIDELGLSQLDLLFPEDHEKYWGLVTKQIEENGEAYLDHLLRRRDGSPQAVFCYGRPFFDSAARAARNEVIIADVGSAGSVKQVVGHARESALRELKHWEDQATRDPLTGLANRPAFRSDVQMRILDENCAVALGIVDIDNFKEYNDTYGHPEGDAMLVHMAHALEKAVGNKGVTCRLGGDEFSFALFLPREIAPDEVRRMSTDIWSTVSAAMQSFRLSATVSMGVALVSVDEVSFRRLYASADRQLYHAKEQGRNRLCGNWDEAEC